MPGSQGLSFCMSRDKYKTVQGPSVTSGSPPPLALSEPVAGSGQAVKKKGRANVPMPGECPSEVLWGGGENLRWRLDYRQGLVMNRMPSEPGSWRPVGRNV